MVNLLTYQLEHFLVVFEFWEVYHFSLYPVFISTSPWQSLATCCYKPRILSAIVRNSTYAQSCIFD